MVTRDTEWRRREFVKAAVAIGGTSALAACTDRLPGGGPDVPSGSDPSTRPAGQHAWNAALPTDEHGNVRNARHHILLLLDLSDEGPPTSDTRAAVETALNDLGRAYEWSADGLLFTVGYSPYYFERFDAGLPESVDLPKPEALSSFEDPALDDPDAVVHLASDHGPVVLEAEAALRGNREQANGYAMDAALTDALAVRDRRTGFVGAGLPADHQDVEGIPDSEPVPEDAPLYMGFKSGFKGNQASEERVTIEHGPFTKGTTEHVSKLRLRLEDWYGEQDHDDRVAEMFCPVHAAEDRIPEGGTGESLGDDSGMGEECVDVEESAREYARIGHSQKMAADAREDGSPLILRRDFDSTADNSASLHFVALQEGIADFVETREAMNGEKYTDNPAIRQRVNNGILEYTFVRRRGNYLVPPRALRALPTPTGGPE
ncbi:MAG: Tat pathway signal protein [Haloglomus sp.]